MLLKKETKFVVISTKLLAQKQTQGTKRCKSLAKKPLYEQFFLY